MTLLEGVCNATFQKGDATKLPFPDESFDAVTNNYVYHNLSGGDKQQLLPDILRVLKKGGTFAFHDFMSQSHYGTRQHSAGSFGIWAMPTCS